MGGQHKPANLRIMEGNRSKTPIPVEPIVTGEPVKPQFRHPAAGEMWNEYVPGLIAAGLAKHCDTPALSAMCEWWAIYQQSMNLGEVAAAAKAYDRWRGLARSFGMTPEDRTKVQISPVEEDSVVKKYLA